MKRTRVPLRLPLRAIERLEDRILLTVQDALDAATVLSPLDFHRNGPSVVFATQQLAVATDVHLYKFTAAKGDIFTADIDAAILTGGLTDSELALFDSSGNAVFGMPGNLGYNDDDPTSGTFDSKLVFTFDTAGDYYLGVTSNDNFNVAGTPDTPPDPPPSVQGNDNGYYTGAYSLKLQLTEADTPDTATLVDLPTNTPTQKAGEIDPTGDVDIYKIHLAVGDFFTADASDSGGGTLSPHLRLFYNGSEVQSGGDGSSIAHLEYLATAAGDYFVAVSDSGNTAYDPTVVNGRSGTSSGQYNLSLLRTPADNNETESTATPVGFFRDAATVNPLPGNTVIVTPTDVDMYKVASLVAGDTLQLNISSPSGSLSPRLRVFDANNNELSPDGGSPLDLSQTFTITTTGAYFVGVSGDGNNTYDPQSLAGRTAGSTGDYQLTVAVTSGTAITDESESGDSLQDPHVIDVPAGNVTNHVSGVVDSANDADYYMFTVNQSGLYTGQVSPGQNSQLNSRITLYGADQHVWATSDDRSLNDYDPMLQVHLVAGTYFLRIDASPSATGSTAIGAYDLSSTLLDANSPFEPQPVGPDYGSATLPVAIASGDFNNDGLSDLVSVNQQSSSISVLLAVNLSNSSQLARGDFSYQPAIVTNTGVGFQPQDVVVGQFNPAHDSNLDIAIANSGDDTVQIFFGNGDGTFALNQTVQLAAGSVPWALVAARLNSDQFTDLAVADSGDGTVRILLGSGTGNFNQFGNPITVGTSPKDIIAGNFDNYHDHRIDLATADSGSDTVTVLFGDGVGGFASTRTLSLPSGSDPTSLVAGNLHNHQEHSNFTDFAVADAGLDRVSLIFGKSNRSFNVQDPISIRQGALSTADGDPNFKATVAIGDFNRDGLSDLVLATSGDSQISIALGTGNGGSGSAAKVFGASQKYASNSGINVGPRDIVVGDLNGDGRYDFATADGQATTATSNPVFHVSMFGGRGDGTFLSGAQLATGQAPLGLVAFDLNHDGRADLVTSNSAFNSAEGGASVLLGLGDGSFEGQMTAPADPASGVAVGDFNGDGRPDLVITTSAPADDGTGNSLYSLEILLGLGDGTYEKAAVLGLGDFPAAGVAIGRFDAADSRPQIAVADQFHNRVLIFRLNSDGTFADAGTTDDVGSQPCAIATGDFNGDGDLDLVTSNLGSGDVSILLGDGHGLFAAASTIAIGQSPGQLTVGNFDGDVSLSGHAIDDLAVKTTGDHQVSVLYGDAGGDFSARSIERLAVDFNPVQGVFVPEGIVAVDLNGDGLLDLVTANNDTNDVSVLINQGSGQFASEQRYALASSVSVAAGPASVVAGDFNGDGRQDVAVSNGTSNNISILLGIGDGTFASAGHSNSSGVHKAPLLVDFNGDGAADSVTMDSQGRVLLRLGRPGQPGVFAPPLVVNVAALNAGVPAADFALFNDGQQHLLGILDRAGRQDSVVTLFSFDQAGSPVAVGAPQDLGSHYDRIVAAKLNSDNRDDLVAIDSAQGMLAKFPRSGAAFAADGPALRMASSVSGVLAANLGLAGVDSLLVSDSQTGTVNLVGISGADSVNYLGGTHTAGFLAAASLGAAPMPLSFDGGSASIVGNFNDAVDNLPDAVIAHRGTNSLSLLLGTKGGGFSDPQPQQEKLVGSEPIDVVAGFFDSGTHLDLAVLDRAGHQVEIYLGDGQGNFAFKASYDVGRSPVGLAVYKVNADSVNDLMITNDQGDVVTLLGNSNGTFRPFTRVNRSMGISVGTAAGGNNVVVTNQSQDRVVVPGQQASGRGDGVNAPSAVRLTDNLGNSINLNSDAFPDMVVANSGGNNVLVYMGIGGGRFDLSNPLAFSVGTDPVDVQVADVDGDGLQDVIATNFGSNDVSILMGTSNVAADGTAVMLAPGVRLDVGQGPVSTQVVLQDGHANPDLLVTNSISNNVYLLPGLGGGFFDDVTLTQFATGNTPVQTIVGNFTGQMGFVTLNYASNSLTFYSGFIGSAFHQEVSSGGSNPLTAVAVSLNDNGTTDLIVGNNGNGVFSLFEGEQAGLSLVNTFTSDALEHPAALAAIGQGQDLQLLALDEGDESLHVFNRESVTSEGLQFIPAQTELASVGTGLLGASTSNFGFVFSLLGALGVSVEGLISQSFTSGDTAGGDGQGNVHSLALSFFEHLGSAIDTGQQIVDSAVEGLGGVLGVHLDDAEVGAAVEGVVSLLFPHVPWKALPSLIHNVLGHASQKLPSLPFAIDEVLENFASEDSHFDIPPGLSQENATPAKDAQPVSIPTAQLAAPIVAKVASNLAALGPKNVAQIRRSPNAVDAQQRVSRAMRMSLGLPVAVAKEYTNVDRSRVKPRMESGGGWTAQDRGGAHQLLAVAAITGAIGAGKFSRRIRRGRDSKKS